MSKHSVVRVVLQWCALIPGRLSLWWRGMSWYQQQLNLLSWALWFSSQGYIVWRHVTIETAWGNGWKPLSDVRPAGWNRAKHHQIWNRSDYSDDFVVFLFTFWVEQLLERWNLFSKWEGIYNYRKSGSGNCVLELNNKKFGDPLVWSSHTFLLLQSYMRHVVQNQMWFNWIPETPWQQCYWLSNLSMAHLFSKVLVAWLCPLWGLHAVVQQEVETEPPGSQWSRCGQRGWAAEPLGEPSESENRKYIKIICPNYKKLKPFFFWVVALVAHTGIHSTLGLWCQLYLVAATSHESVGCRGSPKAAVCG